MSSSRLRPLPSPKAHSSARPLTAVATLVLLGVALFAACGDDSLAGSESVGNGAGGGDGGGKSSGKGGNDGEGGGIGITVNASAASGTGGGGLIGDPKTCEQAATAKTYLGCDFWPTVTANVVWSIFDYAVVVANAGDESATVTVERNGASAGSATIAPNALGTIYLPWVPELKGPDVDCSGAIVATPTTSRVAGGAYHLTSSVPVTVYQFSALEYAGQGGPPGKDWSQCPGLQCGQGCFSYTNDASLLLPSTAFTNNYRITGYPSWQAANLGSFISIAGTEDGTLVTIQVSPFGGIQAGGGIPAASGGQQVNFNIGRGEVVQLFATVPGDLSGSLVQSDKPIQVIHGLPCVFIPEGSPACDHIEESVLPAETLGQHYVVTRPTGPSGAAVNQIVRLVGNVNNTALTYQGTAPANAPATLNAGQVVDLGQVSVDFEITGDHEFAVSTFQLGASAIGSGALGDPAQSQSTAVEQYRTKYVFLAPSDYSVSYVDIVMPLTAQVTLDGAPLAVAPVALSSGFGVARAQLGTGNNGAHLLESSEPVGIQVMGYGDYTSYQYPGGLNLNVIAPPPPPPPPPN